MRAHQEEFTEAGAQLAAIGLGDRTYANTFREDAGVTFPLLIDEKRVAYQAAELKSVNLFHMLRSHNSKARARARLGGHRQHRFGQNPFQLGGSFVFGPGNRDVYTHLSRTFGDNAPIAELLSAVRESNTS